MKWFLFMVIITCGLGISGCGNAITGAAVAGHDIPTSAVPEAHDNTSFTGPAPVEAGIEQDAPVFRHVQYRYSFGDLMFQGALEGSSSGNPLPNAEVTIYCDGSEAGQGKTDGIGDLSVPASDECLGAHEAWLGVEYAGVLYESEHLDLSDLWALARGHGQNGASGLSSSDVPEFPVSGLIFTILSCSIVYALVLSKKA